MTTTAGTIQNNISSVALSGSFLNNNVGYLMSGGGFYTTADGVQALYTYAILGVTPVATPTDFVIIQGSATKTVRIRRIMIGGTATAAGNMPVQVVRRLSTGGTQGSATLTAIVNGSSDNLLAAPTAVVSYVQTANYSTVQTANGVLAVGRAQLPAAGSGVAANPFDLNLNGAKSLILRGSTDYICVNLNGAAVPSGGVLDIMIHTEEDAS